MAPALTCSSSNPFPGLSGCFNGLARTHTPHNNFTASLKRSIVQAALQRRQSLTPIGPLYAHRVPRPEFGSSPSSSMNFGLSQWQLGSVVAAGIVGLMCFFSLTVYAYHRCGLTKEIKTPRRVVHEKILSNMLFLLDAPAKTVTCENNFQMVSPIHPIPSYHPGSSLTSSRCKIALDLRRSDKERRPSREASLQEKVEYFISPITASFSDESAFPWRALESWNECHHAHRITLRSDDFIPSSLATSIVSESMPASCSFDNVVRSSCSGPASNTSAQSSLSTQNDVPLDAEFPNLIHEEDYLDVFEVRRAHSLSLEVARGVILTFNKSMPPAAMTDLPTGILSLDNSQGQKLLAKAVPEALITRSSYTSFNTVQSTYSACSLNVGDFPFPPTLLAQALPWEKSSETLLNMPEVLCMRPQEKI